MVGCGKNKTNESGNNDGSSVSSESEVSSSESEVSSSESEVSSPESEVSSSESAVKYKPSDEILNADFSSGLVQIGNDVFKNGGFFTVKELCEQLEGKYTYEEQFYDREYSTKNRPVLYLTNVKDEELVIRLEYAAPLTDAEKTVPNCIVMNILPDNVYTSSYTWLPNGIVACSTEDRKDEIIELFKSKGYVDATSEDYAEDFLSKTFEQHIGSYVVDCKDFYTLISIQIEGENVYGSNSSTTIWFARFPNVETDNFYYGNHIGYYIGNSLVYWKSPLR
jgi:hypothetical protein